MIQFLRNIYFTLRFFYILLGVATVFVLAFFFAWMYSFALVLLYLFMAICVWEILFLYGKKKPIKMERSYPDKISNGDQNPFEILVSNFYPTTVSVRIIEEIPIPLQIREFEMTKRLKKDEKKAFHYQLRPVQRGEYRFGKCHAFVRHLGFIERRFQLQEEVVLPCYPSFIQLQNYLLMATTNRLEEIGVKRIRRIGATLEFERVKEYQRGDEYRFINWKATGKARKLMVNQYEDERSQPIYSLIDTGRSMRMPFEEMTLLDYAINATLVLSNVTILKNDKAGMLTFSKDVGNLVVADKRNHQMHLISEQLYKIETKFEESEFGRLYAFAKRNLNQRSLLFVYTNFETLDALHRQLPYLQLLNKTHVVVVVIFNNTELKKLARQKAQKSIEIYNQIVAEKFNYEKQLIIQELQAHGIQIIFTEPQGLTIGAINKYLEIKARGLI